MYLKQIEELSNSVSKVVIGKEKVLELILVGLLADGHILIDDVPGVGKTLLAKTLAATLGCDFSRIQFTPDLTPTDVTGFFVYNRSTNEFTFRPGPVMTNILLADEINRTVPRTQSSLLEAMEEKQITVEGQTFHLPKPFLVLATQNPFEQEGTFPLPEAQLDRFLLKVSMGYPNAEEEVEILMAQTKQKASSSIPMIVEATDVLAWQEAAGQITIRQPVCNYLVSLVRATREHPSINLGASPRATVALFRAVKALAFLRKRSYVIPDDIKYLAQPVLAHRLILRREDRLRGLNTRTILDEIMQNVPVPIEKEVNAGEGN